jgi:hypothetical protein
MNDNNINTNLNLMQPNTFQVILDRKKFGVSTYMAQTFNHPSVSLGYAIQPYGKLNIAQPGDKFEIDSLEINFLIDEDMKVYEELYNLMVYTRDVNMNNIPFTDMDEYDHHFQISINLLSNKNNILKTIKYYDCVITDLGNIQFEATEGEDYLTLPSTFQFNSFEVL